MKKMHNNLYFIHFRIRCEKPYEELSNDIFLII